MSFVAISAGVAAASGVVAIGGKVAQGVAASKVDTGAAVDASKELSMAERVQMGTETELNLNKINFKADSMMDAATDKSRASMFDIFKFNEATAKSGFEGSEFASAQSTRVKDSIYSQNMNTVDKIVEESSYDKQAISLSNLKQSADIEKRLQTNITSATSQADTFWEGFGGQGDYKVR